MSARVRPYGRRKRAPAPAPGTVRDGGTDARGGITDATAPDAAAAPPTLAHPQDAHRHAAVPRPMRGREVPGHDMELFDASIADCVSPALAGPLDPRCTAIPGRLRSSARREPPPYRRPGRPGVRGAARPRTTAALVLGPAQPRQSSFTRRRT